MPHTKAHTQVFDDLRAKADATRVRNLGVAETTVDDRGPVGRLLSLGRNPRAAWIVPLSQRQSHLAYNHPWSELPVDERMEMRRRIVDEEATALGVPVRLAQAITNVESWTAQPWAVGFKGEVGLFQVNPRVHTPESVYRTTGSTDLSDPRVNTRFGVSLLRSLHTKHKKWSDVVRAYNGKFNDYNTDNYLQLVARELSAKDAIDAVGAFPSVDLAASIIDSIIPAPTRQGQKMTSALSAASIGKSHDDVFNDIRVNGSGDIPNPAALPPPKITPAFTAMMKKFNTQGLLDTLLALTGKSPNMDVNDVDYEWGSYWGNSNNLMLNVRMDTTAAPDALRTSAKRKYKGYPAMGNRPYVPEVLTHEFGHAVGINDEKSAHGYSRAVLALRMLGADTTNSESTIAAMVLGIHPSLSPYQKNLGKIESTRSHLSDLLKSPMYSEHPLAKAKKKK